MNIQEWIKLNRKPGESFVPTPRIICKDGFSMSVQASEYAYSAPRTRDAEFWSEVECGFPSAEPELIMQCAEHPKEPTETVYGYVPVEEVEKLIEIHGGYDLEEMIRHRDERAKP